MVISSRGLPGILCSPFVPKATIAVGGYHHVVWRIQPLSVVLVGDDGKAPVKLGAGHATGTVLAGHESPLRIDRIAIGVVRRLAEDAEMVVVPQQAHYPVVGDVAEEQIIALAEEGWTLGPAEPRGNPLDAGSAGKCRRYAPQFPSNHALI